MVIHHQRAGRGGYSSPSVIALVYNRVIKALTGFCY